VSVRGCAICLMASRLTVLLSRPSSGWLPSLPAASDWWFRPSSWRLAPGAPFLLWTPVRRRHGCH